MQISSHCWDQAGIQYELPYHSKLTQMNMNKTNVNLYCHIRAPHLRYCITQMKPYTQPLVIFNILDISLKWKCLKRKYYSIHGKEIQRDIESVCKSSPLYNLVINWNPLHLETLTRDLLIKSWMTVKRSFFLFHCFALQPYSYFFPPVVIFGLMWDINHQLEYWCQRSAFRDQSKEKVAI